MTCSGERGRTVRVRKVPADRKSDLMVSNYSLEWENVIFFEFKDARMIGWPHVWMRSSFAMRTPSTTSGGTAAPKPCC